jgi:hypothetical protein
LHFLLTVKTSTYKKQKVGPQIMVRQVVTVDISDFEIRKKEVAEQLVAAARDVGFFYISGDFSCSCAIRQFDGSLVAQLPVAIPRPLHTEALESPLHRWTMLGLVHCNV